jgi:nucleotide-binding universal stress UspA family protein
MHELRVLAAETIASDVKCAAHLEPRVAHGNPSIEILAAATELNASLIVLGATHRSAFQNLTHDRTIYQVLACTLSCDDAARTCGRLCFNLQ